MPSAEAVNKRGGKWLPERTLRPTGRSGKVTSLIFLFYGLANLALLAWGIRLLLRYRPPATVPMLLVAFGLVYDNVMLAAGSMIGHGEMLERLSVPRFFMHAFGTPLLMLSALGLMRRASVTWARTVIAATGIALLTVAMIMVGADADLLRLDLVAKQTGDLVSYGNASASGPPVAPIVTILVLIAAGIAVWRSSGVPWLLLGAVAQFAAAAIGDAITIAGNLGEVALVAGMLLTDSRLARGRDRPTRDRGPEPAAPSRGQPD